ncbi:MAG: enoyl-CoA hydratase/isomerase family protein [Streptosporangiales bacterium]|nr:enoyl-CoA hydratase/isomerase family protein [Streptosporangiales bacterium]
MGDIHLDREAGVAVITVDSPEVRNALTPDMGNALAAVCQEIDGDPEIGAAVVRGAEGTFCSGADRRSWDLQADQSEDRIFRERGAVYSAFVRVGQLRVPTVAAVRGSVVGAGLNLMLATDLRIVAEDTRILAGFLRIGIHPGGGFFTLAGRLAGREATAALGLFSEEIDGRRAAEVGVAWQALPDAEVEPRALELARVAAKDPELARLAVRSFREELGPPPVPWPVALEYERATQMWSQRRRAAP